MKKLLLLVSLSAISQFAVGQTLDNSFQTDITGRPSISLMGVQADDKILLYGEMVKASGVPIHNIGNQTLIRTNKDGSLDTLFKTRSFKDTLITSMRSLSSDHLLLAGIDQASFDRFILKLNSDGSTDESFMVDLELFQGAYIRAIEEIDLNYVIGAENRIIRVDIFGATLDVDTIPNDIEFFSEVYGIVPTPDGKMIIHGFFGEAEGYPSHIIRLNGDGSVDNTFNIGEGADAAVSAVVIQKDGKILVGGRFNTFNGALTEPMVRLDTDGGLDESFLYNASVILRDNRVIALPSENFLVMDRNRVQSYTVNGELIDSRVLSGGSMTGIKKNSDDHVFVAGSFLQRDEFDYRVGALKLDGDLNIDFGFNAKLEGKPVIKAVELNEEGKVLILGDFLKVDGIDRFGFAQLNPDGSLDNTSLPDLLTDSNFAFNFLGSGKTIKKLSSGGFLVTSSARNFILNQDGMVDDAFSLLISTTYTSEGIFETYEQDDGKIIIAGAFRAVNGTDRHNLARVNADGTLDELFNAGDNIDFRVFDIARIGESEAYFLGGNQVNENGGLIRINGTGEIDENFQLQSTYVPRIEALAVQSDGRVVFTGYHQQGSQENDAIPQTSFGRFNTDGSFDGSFRYTKFRGYDVEKIIGDKLLLSGRNEEFDYRLEVANRDGELSPIHGIGVNHIIHNIFVDGDDVYLGGRFSQVAGETHYGLAKIDISDIEENAAPIVQDYQFSFPEDTVVGSRIGTVMALDLENDAISYEIVEGNEESLFEIHITGNLHLLSKEGLDATVKSEFDLIATASDGVNTTEFAININVVHVPQVLSATSVEETLRLFPNPVKNKVTIEGSKIKSITVYDAIGRKVLEKAGKEDSKVVLGLAHLKRGIYILEIHSVDGVQRKKVVKR